MMPHAVLGFLSVVFVAGAARWAWVLARPTATLPRSKPLLDAVAFAATVAAALFAFRPWLQSGMMGSGDSYYYGLQIADFVTQVRRGVMPILIGQSEYAFSGTLHPVRTAPYLTHFAGLLDTVTGQRLSFVQLLNLTVIVTAVLSALATYLAALRLLGGRRLASMLLAMLYVTSPAILAPVALNDMLPTFMAAPWVVIFWFGIGEMLRRTDDLAPQLWAATALALTWYAHSPLAAWLSLFWGVAQVVRFVLAGGAPRQWRGPVFAGVLFIGLTAELWVSVATLDLAPPETVPANFLDYDSAEFPGMLRSAFLPLTAAGGGGSIQLGWALWGGLILTIATTLFQRRAKVWFLSVAQASIVSFLIHIPVVSFVLWSLTPDRLVAQTIWPDQRFYPLLAAGVVITAAQALALVLERRPRFYPIVCGLLLAGCGWSAVQAGVIQQRVWATTVDAATANSRLSPENLVLTRYAYTLLGREPATFSNGWADPEFESRLLNTEMDVVADNASAILATHPTATSLPLAPAATLHFDGAGGHLLEFAFTDEAAKGIITVRASGIDRSYTLPLSGGPLAFGSAPECAKCLTVRFDSAGPHEVVVSSSVPGVRVRPVPFTSDMLPVRMTTQTPYTAQIRAAADSFLETPRVHVQGYEATVNGRTVPVRRSPNGLTTIPVPAGESTVVLSYVGPPLLRICWWISMTMAAGLPWLSLLLLRPATRVASTHEIDSAWIRRHNLFAALSRLPRSRVYPLMAVGVGLVTLSGAGLIFHRREMELRSFGSLRIVLDIPRAAPGTAEPLVVIGRAGAADCVYLVYDDLERLHLGLDHWALGGPVSAPLVVKRGHPHVLEVTIGGLYLKKLRPTRPEIAAKFSNPKSAPFQIVLDGHTVLEGTLPFYEATPAQVAIGRNPVGSSVCREHFSGKILEVERFLPAVGAK